MNKKFLYVLAVVIISIIAIIIFSLRSCEPRVKEIPVSEEVQTQVRIERNDFINANIAFTCEILKDTSLIKEKERSEMRVKEVFKEYNLPVDDNESMIEVLKKYENDPEITEIIKTNSKPCAKGEDPIFVD
ncbi:MAG: hypothetical protein PHP74_01490 [Candidatus Gracilibacteria bacterium]|nr:hypothetical protein [Candidatus Gracilibacteria bacterium]